MITNTTNTDQMSGVEKNGENNANRPRAFQLHINLAPSTKIEKGILNGDRVALVNPITNINISFEFCIIYIIFIYPPPTGDTAMAVCNSNINHHHHDATTMTINGGICKHAATGRMPYFDWSTKMCTQNNFQLDQ